MYYPKFRYSINRSLDNGAKLSHYDVASSCELLFNKNKFIRRKNVFKFVLVGREMCFSQLNKRDVSNLRIRHFAVHPLTVSGFIHSGFFQNHISLTLWKLFGSVLKFSTANCQNSYITILILFFLCCEHKNRCKSYFFPFLFYIKDCVCIFSVVYY